MQFAVIDGVEHWHQVLYQLFLKATALDVDFSPLEYLADVSNRDLLIHADSPHDLHKLFLHAYMPDFELYGSRAFLQGTPLLLLLRKVLLNRGFYDVDLCNQRVHVQFKLDVDLYQLEFHFAE